MDRSVSCDVAATGRKCDFDQKSRLSSDETAGPLGSLGKTRWLKQHLNYVYQVVNSKIFSFLMSAWEKMIQRDCNISSNGLRPPGGTCGSFWQGMGVGGRCRNCHGTRIIYLHIELLLNFNSYRIHRTRMLLTCRFIVPKSNIHAWRGLTKSSFHGSIMGKNFLELTFVPKKSLCLLNKMTKHESSCWKSEILVPDLPTSPQSNCLGQHGTTGFVPDLHSLTIKF